MALIGAILGILATWVVLALIFTGVGLGVRSALDRRAVRFEDLLGSFWLGFALTVLFLQVWHLLLPIDWRALAVVTGGGGMGMVLARRAIRGGQLRPQGIPLAVLALVSLWLAYRALNPDSAFDTAMYHFPFVKWAKLFPSIPGLGNLHSRLGFNNSSLLYATMLDAGPWADRSRYIAQGLLIWVLFLHVLGSIGNVLHCRFSRSDLFNLVLLAPAVALAQSTSISSLSPDVAAAIVLFVAASALLSLLSDPQTTEGGLQFGLLLITTLLVVAVTFKSTVAVFAALAWPLAILAAYRVSRGSASRRPIERTVLAALALSLALGVSWVVSGLVTTGYPAYPSDLWGIPADWRVPEEQAQAELAWIGHWARNYFRSEARNFIPYGARLTWEWRWLAPWLASLFLHVQALWTIVLPLLLVALSVSAHLRQRRRSLGDADRPAGRGWWLMLPTTLGLLFWFLVAPRPLFGLPLFWILAATVAAHVVDGLARRRAWTGRRIVTMAIVVAALPLLVTPFPGLLRGAGTGLTPTWNPLLEMPGGHVLEPAPQVAVGRFTTDSGLLLYVPADNRCWDAPLPCTPHPASNLTLRRPGSLASGFRVEGGWLAQRYPSRHSTFLSLWRQYVGD